MGMSKDDFGNNPVKYPIDPESFKIINDEVHLFYNQEGLKAIEYWNKNEQSIMLRADSLWLSLSKVQFKKWLFFTDHPVIKF